MGVVKKRVVAGVMAFLFVLGALAAWWLFASLAAKVVSCVPWNGVSGCHPPFPNHDRLDLALRIATLILSLLAAIWVAMRAFFTAPTFEPTNAGVAEEGDDGRAADDVRAEPEGVKSH
jgi:hypothetical protein